jgi:hypothetical protein
VDSSSGAAFTAAEALVPKWPRLGYGAVPAVKADGQNSETVQTIGDGTLGQESVNITTLPVAANRSTLQVGFDVVWRDAKPVAERVPDSPVLTVSEDLVSTTSSAATTHEVTLTDRAEIAQIAAEINALPTDLRYGAYHCPAVVPGTVLTLEFRKAAGGPPLAQVRLSTTATGPCGGSVMVTLGGTAQPGLDDDGDPLLAVRIAERAGLPIPALI